MTEENAAGRARTGAPGSGERCERRYRGGEEPLLHDIIRGARKNGALSEVVEVWAFHIDIRFDNGTHVRTYCDPSFYRLVRRAPAPAGEPKARARAADESTNESEQP